VLVQGKTCVKWVREDFQRLRAFVHILTGRRMSRQMPLMDAWRDAAANLALPFCDDDCDCGDCAIGNPPPALPAPGETLSSLALMAIGSSVPLPDCSPVCQCDICTSDDPSQPLLDSSCVIISSTSGVPSYPAPAQTSVACDESLKSYLAPRRLLAITWYERSEEPGVQSDDVTASAPPPSPTTVPASEEPAVKDDVAIPAPSPPPSPTHVSASTDSGDTHEDQAAPSDDVTITPLVDAASAPASQLAPLTNNSASGVAAVTETSNTSAPSDSSSNEEEEEEQEKDNHLDSPSAPSPSALIAMLEQMATDLAAYKVQAMQEREEDRVKQKNLQKVIDQEWRRAVEDLTEKCAQQDKEIGLLQRKCQGLDQSLKDIKRERACECRSKSSPAKCNGSPSPSQSPDPKAQVSLTEPPPHTVQVSSPSLSASSSSPPQSPPYLPTNPSSALHPPKTLTTLLRGAKTTLVH
jgi:hypothetical protein